MWLAVSSWAGPCVFQANSPTLPWESALCGFVIELVGHHLQLVAVEVGPRVFQPLRAPSARQGADRLLAVDSAALDCVLLMHPVQEGHLTAFQPYSRPLL